MKLKKIANIKSHIYVSILASLVLTGCANRSAIENQDSAPALDNNVKLDNGYISSDVIENQFGYFQVAIKLENNKISEVKILKSPDGESQPYSDIALPKLVESSIGKINIENIDSVSGASYTTDGYKKALQSAIDKF